MNKILGIGRSDSEDELTQKEFGVVTLEFTNNGELVYTIYENGKMQKVF